jgi:hypothetical protein
MGNIFLSNNSDNDLLVLSNLKIDTCHLPLSVLAVCHCHLPLPLPVIFENKYEIEF